MPMRITATILFLVASLDIWAQSISGYAKDFTDNPVVFAGVVVTGCQDDQVLAYTNTDDRGYYRLEVHTSCDSITLTVRALGYKTHASTHDVRALPVAYNLTLEGTVLQEVIIKGKTPPVIARGDTTEYHVAAFSDSTEFSVEDLLKKLPGAQISETGRITLNGKDVDRVLIEGDDLFSQNYQIATRNLRANMVSKIQSIDRYQENPLMKGIQESDRLVLNLKVKEDKKYRIAGSATLGSGYGDEIKLFAHSSLFSITRREKTYLIGNANNTGYNAIGSTGGLSQGDVFDRNRQSLQNNPLSPDVLVSTSILETAGLPLIFSRTNRTGLVYLGHVLPVSTGFKIRMSGWLAQERLQQQVTYDSRYLLDSGYFSLTENRRTGQQSGIRNFQAELDYFFSDHKQSLRSFIQINGSPEQETRQVLRTANGTLSESLDQHLSGRPFQSLATVEYTFKTGESSLFQLAARDAHFDARQTLLPVYDYYPAFFGLDSSFVFLRQGSRQFQHLNALNARYLGRRWSLHWTLEVGAQQESGQLQSDVTLENAEGVRQQAGEDFRNNFRMRTSQVYGRASAHREFGAFYSLAGIVASWSPVHLQSKGSNLATEKSLLAEPYMTMRYTFTEKTFLLLNYRFQQRLPRFADYFSDYIFTDYQSLRRGLPFVAVMPGHSATLRFSHNNRVKQYAWNMAVGGSRTANQAGGQFRINPYLFIQDLYRPVRSDNYSVVAGGHRYFPALRSRFDAGFTLNGNRRENKINNDVPRLLDSRLYAGSLEYGTAFDGWVNVLLSGKWFYSTTENRLEHSVSTFSATTWQTSAQLIFKPSKRVSAKLYLYRFDNRTGRQPSSSTYAAQAEGMWRFPAWHSTLQVSGVNLFASGAFRQVAVDAFIESVTSVEAVRPFFLVQWDYSF